MISFMSLHVSVWLKHILDREPTLADYEDSDSDATETTKASRQRDDQRRGENPSTDKIGNGAELLDFDGPKLSHGCKNWLAFYQLVGQINFIGRPLYVSIIYKLLICSLLFYSLIFRYLLKLYNLHLIKDTFRNPIFLFISFLAAATFMAQVLVSLHVNLFDLCPLYKILTTPKLCFVKTEVQHIIGTRSLSSFLVVQLYNTLLMSMLLTRSVDDFFNQFDLFTFLLDYYFITVFAYYLVGLTQMDLYIRLAFGHWLMALKSHLEFQFTYLHSQQRRSMRQSLAASGQMPTGNRQDSRSSELRKRPLRLITFNEVQKNLNNMDDHLEVWRSVQIGNIVLLTLNAFLANGALFLLTYHLIADQSDYYHGCILLLLSINYIVSTFMSYSGDRWLFYALSSFVQTVEDEYFMQNDIKISNTLSNQQEGSSSIGGDSTSVQPLATLESDTNMIQQLLLIKKKDVLFCREFLHQFENHLATPWSKLTLKSHLHMLRTFVTLVAAQIIFDDEH